MVLPMSRFQVRVVCHAVLHIDFEPQLVRVLQAEVRCMMRPNIPLRTRSETNGGASKYESPLC